jgi:hypothetical protein
MYNTNYQKVGNRLGNVSKWTLSQIADSINAILTSKEPVPKPAKEKQKDGKEEDAKRKTPATPPNPSANITIKIIQYIKGSELDKQTLQKYKNTERINTTLKASIQLCLDFWSLDGSDSGKKSNTYWTLRDKVNSDDILKGSKLKNCLDEICKEKNPSYAEMYKKKKLNGQ